mmetsp:Transcript_89870/g.164920  ORF Transcript_89870/g.164920 Transcript_89870/m.164920 type:complete len:127 (-) Transcript_89870:110-490(-)
MMWTQWNQFMIATTSSKAKVRTRGSTWPSITMLLFMTLSPEMLKLTLCSKTLRMSLRILALFRYLHWRMQCLQRTKSVIFGKRVKGQISRKALRSVVHRTLRLLNVGLHFFGLGFEEGPMAASLRT